MTEDFAQQIEAPELFEAVALAVRDGMAHVREMQEQRRTIIGHLDSPTLSYFSNGLPHLSSKTFDGPPDYVWALSNDKEWKTPPSWEAVCHLVPKFPQLKRYFAERDSVERYLLEVNYLLKRLVDRTISLSGSTEFSDEAFWPIYVEWERAVFLDELPFDILVPLLLVKVDVDTLDFGEEMAIEKLSEPLQLARAESRTGAVPRDNVLIGAATHALVLKNWHITNDAELLRWVRLSEPESFRDAREMIDLFFASLRAIVGVETGYAQLVARPYNWGDRWEAHLPHVTVAPVKAYPEHFNERGWWRTPPVVSGQQLTETFQLYELLRQNKANKIVLACRRLNGAYLRQNEEDTILDITIALEALLADDGKSGEITYRLAMRLASLSSVEPFQEHWPQEVFDFCKRIYDYRSAVVHGSHQVEKKRVVSLKDRPEPIPTVHLALELLRYALRVLTRHPELLDVKAMDSKMLQTFK